MAGREEILKLFPGILREILGQVSGNFEEIQEIRLRAEQPVIIIRNNREYFLTPSGALRTTKDGAAVFHGPQIQEMVEYMGNYSLYAFEEEVRRGFLTLQGGHRVGLAGQAVLESWKEPKISELQRNALLPAFVEIPASSGGKSQRVRLGVRESNPCYSRERAVS